MDADKTAVEREQRNRGDCPSSNSGSGSANDVLMCSRSGAPKTPRRLKSRAPLFFDLGLSGIEIVRRRRHFVRPVHRRRVFPFRAHWFLLHFSNSRNLVTAITAFVRRLSYSVRMDGGNGPSPTSRRAT